MAIPARAFSELLSTQWWMQRWCWEARIPLSVQSKDLQDTLLPLVPSVPYLFPNRVPISLRDFGTSDSGGNILSHFWHSGQLFWHPDSFQTGICSWRRPTIAEAPDRWRSRESNLQILSIWNIRNSQFPPRLDFSAQSWIPWLQREIYRQSSDRHEEKATLWISCHKPYWDEQNSQLDQG